MLVLQARLGDWELVRPGRELLKEGLLQKISRKGVGPRYFILLSDCLLYCEFSGTGGDTSLSSNLCAGTGPTSALRLSYTIELSQLHVHVPRAEEFQHEFSITSSVRSCTLRARDLKERNEWLEALNSAIEEFRSRKATFLAVDQLSGLPAGEEEECVGGAAPVWIPDQRVTMCQECSTEFGLVVRRHHCRACGRVVCNPCSASKAPLRWLYRKEGLKVTPFAGIATSNPVESAISALKLWKKVTIIFEKKVDTKSPIHSAWGQRGAAGSVQAARHGSPSGPLCASGQSWPSRNEFPGLHCDAAVQFPY